MRKASVNMGAHIKQLKGIVDGIDVTLFDGSIPHLRREGNFYLITKLADIKKVIQRIEHTLVFTGTEEDLKYYRQICSGYATEMDVRAVCDEISGQLEQRLVREKKTPQKSLEEVLGNEGRNGQSD